MSNLLRFKIRGYGSRQATVFSVPLEAEVRQSGLFSLPFPVGLHETEFRQSTVGTSGVDEGQ